MRFSVVVIETEFPDLSISSGLKNIRITFSHAARLSIFFLCFSALLFIF